MNCIFCHKENLTTDIVYEDDRVMAFMDMNPINEGHVLLVPKEHYLDVDELPDEILSHLMITSKKIVTALKQIYQPDGYSIMQNGGTFNDVGHYHLHIFPRYQGDGFGWNYDNGKFNYCLRSTDRRENDRGGKNLMRCLEKWRLIWQ